MIPISELLVNPDNPRFDSVVNQKEAIEKMLDEKGPEIKKLAQDIIDHGINPTKSLAVLASSNGKFVTLEGNRRVVSLILLNEPTKTKNLDFREFFQQLKNKYQKQIPNSVSSIVFEKEEDARHWLMLEHTGKNQGVGVDPWDSEQKDRFLQKASKQLIVFDFADANRIKRTNVDATNLERLLSTPHVCNAIGISFSGGELTMKKPKSVVKNNLKKVFAKMSKVDFKVGDIYTKELRENWINKVLGSKSESYQTQKTTPEQGKGKSKGLPKTSTRKHLVPDTCDLVIKQSRINNIFRELKDDLILDGSEKSTPNAVGVLFRVFLEASLTHYLIKRVKIAPSIDMTINQKIEKATKFMEDNRIATPTQLKAIRVTASGKRTDILHIHRFHEYVHSSMIHPESETMKAKWDNLQEFFEILWEDVEKKGLAK